MNVSTALKSVTYEPTPISMALSLSTLIASGCWGTVNAGTPGCEHKKHKQSYMHRGYPVIVIV